MKKLLHIFLLILCVSIIFYFSSQPGNVSSKTSESFLSLLVKEDSYFFEHSKKIIRKFGHMFEFFVATYLVYLVVNDYEKNINKKYLFTLAIALAIAASDELHQTFIPFRTGALSDVGIDSIGILFCLSIIIFFNKHKKIRN